MRTKRIILHYGVTHKNIIPPDAQAVRRKDEWIKELQKTADHGNPLEIRVTYELFNPEIRQQVKFFNGAVVAYYAIQNEDMVTGEPDRGTIERARETILDETLGYNVDLMGGKTTRRRHTTSDFNSTQKWHDFIETVHEGIFDPSGYEFPDSERFWAIADEVGYLQAKKVAIRELQERMKKKLSTD